MRTGRAASFPRLYAAASLKPLNESRRISRRHVRFPRLYAAASLKPVEDIPHRLIPLDVFRGFMPRPH